jgi:tetratricopeptide (TPR) repeat protein
MPFLSLFRRVRVRDAGGAGASLIQSIERNPDKDPPYIDFLAACERQGDFDGAITYLAALSTRRPRLETAYRFLLAAYRRKGDVEGLKKAIEQRPEAAGAHGWFLMDAYTKNDWDGAIVLLSVLVKLHPREDKWARYLLAAFEMKRDPEAAILGVTELLKACPESGVLRRYLADDTSKSMLRAKGDETPSSATGTPPASASDSATFHSSPGRAKTEWEKTLELKDKFRDIDARERERRRVEDQTRLRPRALSAREKFSRIRPTGSRDGFG